ncbi:MAG: hypothetical protein ABIA08_00230 [bacterium]
MEKLLGDVKIRWSLSERENEAWFLSEKLFGDTGADIYDFEANNYVYFLDNVSSHDELVEGLRQLSPLIDDVLSIAEGINEQEFRRFKRLLVKERRGEYSNMPKKFRTLIMPAQFIPATLLANRFEVPLGTALVRLIELEEN